MSGETQTSSVTDKAYITVPNNKTKNLKRALTELYCTIQSERYIDLMTFLNNKYHT